MEMTGLESQEEDDPRRVLFFKPMSWWDRLGLTTGTNPGLLVSVRLFFHVNGRSDPEPSDYGEASCGLRLQNVSGRCTG
jgi:hypothetical protein